MDSEGVCPDCSSVETPDMQLSYAFQGWCLASQAKPETDSIMKHLTDACKSGFERDKPAYMYRIDLFSMNHFVFMLTHTFKEQ